MDKSKNTSNDKIGLVELQNMDHQAKERTKQGLAKDLTLFERVAKKAVSKIAHGALSEPMLAEALHTKQVPNTNYSAVQVGNFAVFSIPNAQGKPRYTVANQADGSKLVENLHLVETASGIVKLMNKSYSFFSPQVRNLLEFEEKYTKFYNDAVSARRKIKDNPTKDAIMESRFEDAKYKALQIKEQLSDYLKKI